MAELVAKLVANLVAYSAAESSVRLAATFVVKFVTAPLSADDFTLLSAKMLACLFDIAVCVLKAMQP